MAALLEPGSTCDIKVFRSVRYGGANCAFR